MSNSNISLGEFERRHGINKGTVSKRARELGFNTQQGLSPDAYEVMKADFAVGDESSPEVVKEFSPTEIDIYDGNHRHTLTPPPVPHQINLGTLRDDIPVHAYEQPLAMIEDTLSYIQVRRSAMTQDLETRLHLFQQTEAAAAELQRQVRALELEEMRYQTESRLLGLLQNRATAEMQQHLGKVCGDGSSSSPG